MFGGGGWGEEGRLCLVEESDVSVVIVKSDEMYQISIFMFC